MSDTHDRGARAGRGARDARRGAAMIVAIAIMTILLAIALTFYSVSRVEFDTSTNVINSVRGELQAKGAIAIAEAHLNDLFNRAPQYTGIDQSYRTYFNGSWAAGKYWTMRNGTKPGGTVLPMMYGGVAELNLYQIERAIGAQVGEPGFKLYARLGNGSLEPLFHGPVTRGWLYVPRVQKNVIVLYDSTVQLVYLDKSGNNMVQVPLDLATLNGYIASAGINARFRYFSGDAPNPANNNRVDFPFITSDLYGMPADPDTGGPFLPVSLADDPDGLLYPEEQIAKWADVDIDGDGLNDAAWIPMQADLYFPADGIDNNLNGLFDESQDNGLDDDGDGSADYDAGQLASRPGDLLRTPTGTNAVFDEDEQIENAPFIYWGNGPDRLGDGLDNDGDGTVDEADEDKLFLTVPLPGMRVQIDLDDNGLLDANDLRLDDRGEASAVWVTVPDELFIRTSGGTLRVTAADVDMLDNDYDQEVNEIDAYAYVGPHAITDPTYDPGLPVSQPYVTWQPYGNWGDDRSQPIYSGAHLRGFNHDINADVYLGGPGNLDITPNNQSTAFLQQPNALHLTIGGEPVCELVGRAAILVTDEASKPNINVAHALTYRDLPDEPNPTNKGLVQRAFGEGLSPAEYDLRAVPGLGVELARKIAEARYGAPGGVGLAVIDGTTEALGAGTDALTSARMGRYYYDASLPGYGRVDDDANSIILAFNGRNDNGNHDADDGSGLIDEGLVLPVLSQLAERAITTVASAPEAFPNLSAAEQQAVLAELLSSRFQESFRHIGALEGIDDPGEFRRFNATRNRLAETDLDTGTGLALDNDDNGVANEIGELGDAPYQTYDQLQQRVSGIGDATAARMKNLLSVHSTDRNVSFIPTNMGIRAKNKINPNYATASQIAAALIIDGALAPITDARDTATPVNADQIGDTLVGSELLSDLSKDNRKVAVNVGEHNTNAFAEGLRQADVGINAPAVDLSISAGVGGLLRVMDGADEIPTTSPGAAPLDGSAHPFPADPILQAMLAAVNLVDNRDADHGRSVLRTEDIDTLPGAVDTRRNQPPAATLPAGVRPFLTADYPASGDDIPPRERIAPDELLPLEEVEEQLRTPLGVNLDRAELGFYHAAFTNITNNTGSGIRRLQALDAWWANFVTSAETTDGTVGGPPTDRREQRHISYAVAGAEAVRINELMVRPVRRVEAEAVTLTDPFDLVQVADSDPMRTLVTGAPSVADAQAIMNDFNPTPFQGPPFDAAIPHGRLPLPLFSLKRDHVFNHTVNPPPTATPTTLAGNWKLAGNFFRDPTSPIRLTLGDTTGVDSDTPVIPASTALGKPLPDIIEYTIVSQDTDPIIPNPSSGNPLALDNTIGLPEGRYYLTLNMADEYGRPTIEATGATAPLESPLGPFDSGSMPINSPIFYAIKYVDRTNVNDRSILGDVKFAHKTEVDAGSGVGYEDYMNRNWQSVPKEHYAGGENGLRKGERPGWVWLDGTPADVRGRADVATYGNYFTEFGDGSPPTPPMTQFIGGNLTHTVYVPPASSNWQLHIAVCVASSTVASPTRINFFDFSQEPDHEWVELANISDKMVDVSNWTLEVGIPDVKDQPADPYRSKWKIPPATKIAAGGFLLLAFNRFDYFEWDRATSVINPADDLDVFPNSLVYNNGMGLARGLTAALYAGVDGTDVTCPPIHDPAPNADPFSEYDRIRGLPDSNAAGLRAGLLEPSERSFAFLFQDLTGSVFERTANPLVPGREDLTDYIDNDGDGVTSQFAVASASDANGTPAEINAVDTDNVQAEAKLASTGGLLGNKAWDRVVQLINLQIDTQVNPAFPDSPLQYVNGAPMTLKDIVEDPGAQNERLARLILRGGVLPNYPEHDGIDNDGDGGYIKRIATNSAGDIEEVEYVPGALDLDLVDNDLDGFADVFQVAVDQDGSGIYESDDTHREVPDPSLSEGVDEGGNDLPYGVRALGIPPGTLPTNIRRTLPNLLDRRFGAAGSYERTTLPVRFLANRYLERTRRDAFDDRINMSEATAAARTADLITLLNSLINPADYLTMPEAPGIIDFGSASGLKITPAFTFDVQTTPDGVTVGSLAEQQGLVGYFGLNLPGLAAPDLTGMFVPPSIVPTGDAPYLGTRDDPPDWKAFVERRWNPGDCVVVSLYTDKFNKDGTMQVADRATYREFDVIDRTIDDEAPTPYHPVIYTPAVPLVSPATYAEDVTNDIGLNADYPTFWLPDQMGLDFYRSLERKDPRYAGDRFGTRNRWEATDGNYDDWADSISLAARTIFVGGMAQTWYETNAGDRFPPAAADLVNGEALRLYGHAVYGSPLRMNTPCRVTQNPPDLVALLDRFTQDPAASGGTKNQDALLGRPYAQFYAVDRFIYGAPDLLDSPKRENRDWQMTRAGVFDTPYNSLADTLSTPFVTFAHVAVNAAAIPNNGGPITPPFLADLSAYNKTLRFGNFTGNAIGNLDPHRASSLLGVQPGGVAEPSPIMGDLSDIFSTDALVLSVGQAKFTPILPVPDTNFQDLIEWYPPVLDPDETPGGRIPPAAWAPVFLFELPGDSTAQPNINQWPNYPSFPSGVNAGRALSNPLFLLNRDFMFNRAGNPFQDALGIGAVNAVYNADVRLDDFDRGPNRRWPMEKRIVAYISSNPINHASGASSDPRVDDVPLVSGVPDPGLLLASSPEALFTWDADSGLENGEYTLYVGTYIPGLNDKLGRTDYMVRNVQGLDQALGGNNILLQPYTAGPLLTPEGLIDFLRLDPVSTVDYTLAGLDPIQSVRPQFKPRFVMEAITEPTLAQGLAVPRTSAPLSGPSRPGLTPPGEWFPDSRPFEASPGPDGYILYGDSGGATWRAKSVKVTRNFLALRVRNVGDPGEIGVITHIVLAPRKRTPGRININTVTNRIVTVTSPPPQQRQIFNGLLGLPGVLDVLASSLDVNGNRASTPLGDDDDVAVVGDNSLTGETLPIVGYASWNDDTRLAHNVPPEVFVDQQPVIGGLTLPRPDRLAEEGTTSNNAVSNWGAAFRLSSLLIAGRPKHADGRYFTQLSDLVQDAARFPHPNPSVPYFDPINQSEPRDYYMLLSPLSNAAASAQRFDEAAARLRRMGNSITTRSDVFEISVKVQAGYAIDLNGDGQYNYRSTDEFVTTGEKQARVVYERRVPSDRSDEPDTGNR